MKIDLHVHVSHGALLRGLVSRRAFQHSRRERNPLERDVGLKRAMGFPEESFTRAAGLLRLPSVPVPCLS